MGSLGALSTPMPRPGGSSSRNEAAMVEHDPGAIIRLPKEQTLSSAPAERCGSRTGAAAWTARRQPAPPRTMNCSCASAHAREKLRPPSQSAFELSRNAGGISATIETRRDECQWQQPSSDAGAPPGSPADPSRNGRCLEACGGDRLCRSGPQAPRPHAARRIAQGSLPYRRAGGPGPCFVLPGFAGQSSLNPFVFGE